MGSKESDTIERLNHHHQKPKQAGKLESECLGLNTLSAVGK